MKLSKHVIKIADYVYRDIPIILMGNKDQMFYLFNFDGKWYSQSLKLARETTVEKAKEAFETIDIGFDTPLSALERTIDRLNKMK